jgi:hypothetical protein
LKVAELSYKGQWNILLYILLLKLVIMGWSKGIKRIASRTVFPELATFSKLFLLWSC